MKNITNMSKKRKAIDCKLVRPSNSNPGYFKYEVTIEEKDGSTHTQPAYGKDMQDAISRLIWNERIKTINTSRKVDSLIFVVWALVLVVPAVISQVYNSPEISIVGMVSLATVGTALYYFYKWISKQ
jgi:hypothetical protein